MNVADFKPCPFTGQAAGAQGAETAFMRDFSQRVRLVHELGQLAGTEEFFNRCNDRTDIDQDLRRNAFGVLNRHAFADDAFHTGQADAELVLEQFADAAEAAVAQMVDVVDGAEAVHEVQQVIYVGDNIFAGNRAVIVRQIAVIADNLIYGPVDFFYEGFYEPFAGEYAAFFNFVYFGRADFRMSVDDHFTRFGMNDRFVERQAEQPAFPAQLFAGFIAADAGHIVPARVEKQPFEQIAGAFYCRRFTGAEFFIDFYEGFILVFRRIFFKGILEPLIIEEQVEDFCIGRPAQGADQHRDGDFAVAVYTGIYDAVYVRFQFDPGAAVRNDRRVIQHGAHRIAFAAVIYARRAHELADDNAFCPIDNKCTCICNQREIPHEYFLVFNFPCFMIDKTDLNPKRRGICRVSFLAFPDVILRFPQFEIFKG